MTEYTPKIESPLPVQETQSMPKPERKDVLGLPGATKELGGDERPLILLGIPHVIEDYQLGGLYNQNIDQLKERGDLIDAYIKIQIEKKEWKPTVKSYKDILEDLKGKAGAHENLPNLTQIMHMYYYVKNRMS